MLRWQIKLNFTNKTIRMTINYEQNLTLVRHFKNKGQIKKRQF